MATFTSSLEEYPLHSSHYHNNGLEECIMRNHPPSPRGQSFDLKTGMCNHVNSKSREQEPTTTESSFLGNYQSQDQNGEGNKKHMQKREEADSSCGSSSPSSSTTSDGCSSERDHQVLVVAGCNCCFMYFMLPKGVEQCPKCNNASLLHFHKPPIPSSSTFT